MPTSSIATAFERAAGRSREEAVYPAATVSEPPMMSVALGSYNRRDSLARALDALTDQTYPVERFEVVVVLDGSTDGSAELVRSREYPYRLKLVEQRNSGLAAARNRGAAEAEGDVVVFGDDDILLDRQCLAAYADAHRRRGPEHVVFGAAWIEAGDDVWSGLVRDWWERQYRRKADPGHLWTFMDVADGMASIPRRLFQDTGGFDESFRERRQDWEWGVRLCEAGARFSQSLEASGRHYADTSISSMLRYSRQEGRSDVQLGTKYPALRGRLFMGRFAHGRGAARARAVFSNPRPADLAVRIAMPVTTVLVRARARPALARVMGRLHAYAYVAGLRDALGSVEALDEFLAPVASGRHRDERVVDLSSPAPLEVPRVGGALEVVVTDGPRELARVPGLMPGDQWNWDSLSERVVEALGEKVR